MGNELNRVCARGPDFWKADRKECQYNPAQKIEAEALKTAGAITSELQKFSALRLADGTFWEEPGNKLYLGSYWTSSIITHSCLLVSG